MLADQDKPVLVVTNPLHYTYFRQKHVLPTIASSNGLLSEHARELGFVDEVTLLDAANSIEDILDAAHKRGLIEEGRACIAWKASEAPYLFLGNPYKTAHDLERKAFIRSLLPAELFPAFQVVAPSNLAQHSFEELAGKLGASELVLQIDFSTGGKGTFFVADQEEFTAVLPQLEAANQDIVVSKKIAGTSRALQCFLTRSGVSGLPWWHQDLVGIEGVCNLEIKDATRYCGAILENIPSGYMSQVRALQEKVGEALQKVGYFGVFGMDIVEDKEGKVYLIEVNPRFTAVSHVYATAMHAVGYQTDFLTAHVEALLDNSGPGDKVLEDFAEPRLLKNKYYYLKLQNTSTDTVMLDESCKLGAYDTTNSYVRFAFGVDGLEGQGELVVIPESGHKVSHEPGSRMFSVIGAGDPLDGANLNEDLKRRLNSLTTQFTKPLMV